MALHSGCGKGGADTAVGGSGFPDAGVGSVTLFGGSGRDSFTGGNSPGLVIRDVADGIDRLSIQGSAADCVIVTDAAGTHAGQGAGAPDFYVLPAGGSAIGRRPVGGPDQAGARATGSVSRSPERKARV